MNISIEEIVEEIIEKIVKEINNINENKEKDIENIYNTINDNYIIAEIFINKNDINKEIRINLILF